MTQLTRATTWKPTSDDNITTQDMRDVMGAFCSGVVVVTAAGENLHGFTCQSFASLSLDPPLITFSPARTSTTWPKIREVGTFCINVLAHDHEHLSAQFARSGADKFAGVDWEPAPLGSPILNGVSAWIECTLWDEYDGGDHTVVLGAVESLASDVGRHPLLYYRGRYPTASWTQSA